MNVKIIAVCGKSGAGKTTIAKFLANILKATAICWDDFNGISSRPSDPIDWYNRGQDYKEFDYEKLACVLWTLKTGAAIIHPTLNTYLTPTRYIILDTPFGRLHHQTGQYIDYCFYIDTPMDILLNRRATSEQQDRYTSCKNLKEFNFYTSISKPFFSEGTLKSSADFIINGTLSINAQVLAIKHYLSYQWYNSQEYDYAT